MIYELESLAGAIGRLAGQCSMLQHRHDRLGDIVQAELVDDELGQNALGVRRLLVRVHKVQAAGSTSKQTRNNHETINGRSDGCSAGTHSADARTPMMASSPDVAGLQTPSAQ